MDITESFMNYNFKMNRKQFNLKFLLVSLFSGFSLLGMAQPVLTEALNPVVGDVYTYNSQNISSGINPGPSGAGVTWNFNFTTDSVWNTVTWFAPTSSPFNSQFPEANIASFNSFGKWEHFITGDSLINLGDTIMRYSDPKITMSFPETFNKSFTDSFAGVYSPIPGSQYNFTGDLTVNYDAYGTLLLPWASFTNVARIHTHENMVVPGIAFDSTRIDKYQWFTSTEKFPVLTMAIINTIDNDTAVITQYYVELNSVFVNVKENESLADFKLFPNPATDEINLKGEGRFRWELFDSLGRLVNDSKGVYVRNETKLDVSALKSGLYFIKITGESGAVKNLPMIRN